jgi:hypothetical protein
MSETDLTTLTDIQLLEVCNLQMPDNEQSELSDLLAQNRESQLTPNGLERLQELMQIYRHGLVRKAEAMKIAVQRGLRPSLI